MVLKARDYGFIGLKLKGLIFHGSGNLAVRALNMHWLEGMIVKENVRWRLTNDE